MCSQFASYDGVMVYRATAQIIHDHDDLWGVPTKLLLKVILVLYKVIEERDKLANRPM